MAKTTKKTTKTNDVEKKTVSAEIKTSKTTTKKDNKADGKDVTKVLTTKEPKKITAAKEPKKIAAKKEPDKIAAKPQPEKIETVVAEQIEMKNDDKMVKEAVKQPKKKTVKKSETKVAVANDDKPKKTTKTKAVKTDVKTKKETAVKKPVKEKAIAPHDDIYRTWSLDVCLQAMQSMGVQYSIDDYKRILLDEAEINVLEKNIIEGNDLLKKGLSFEKDGYDEGLVAVILNKIMETMDLKAADFPEMKKEIEESVDWKLSEDNEGNAAEYLKEFKLCEKILMLGQRKNIINASEISILLDTDITTFVHHFFDLAYEILPSWQYDDVKYYEDFVFAVLSQYADLYEASQLRILIDVADLYIKHGDFHHGDVCYGYILRDNQIKDYIYYRFAHIYEDIDLNKAKALAYESMQYVDERYTYYQNIMDIINK